MRKKRPKQRYNREFYLSIHSVTRDNGMVGQHIEDAQPAIRRTTCERVWDAEI
jgi:hypothetical protein